MSRIVGLSNADTWDLAKLEWGLDQVYLVDKDSPGICLCGHRPIIEHCVLLNRDNGNTAIVGNVCVGKFLDLPSHKIFDALARITANRHAALNAETIVHAKRMHWLNKWETNFYLDTLRKRRLSERQRYKRFEINTAVLRHMRAAGAKHHA